MKIVVLSPFLPYPGAKAGAPQAIYDRLCLLLHNHMIVLVSMVERGEEHHIAHLRSMGIEVRPVVRSTHVRGIPLWRKRLWLAASLLFGKLPTLVIEFRSGAMRKCLLQTLDEFKPDLLLVEHRLVAQYLLDIEVGARRHALFSEHDARGGSTGFRVPRPLGWPVHAIEASRWATFTRRVWEGAAAVLVPTEEDAVVIHRRAPGVPVEVVPYGLVRPGLCEEGDVSQRNGSLLLFVGNFDHPPNRDAALRLARTILPGVRRSEPSVELVLVGKNPTPEILLLASEGNRVRVTGEVESVEPYLRRCALFVAPLSSGGGARMKLMEAAMAGAPIITTKLGAQGLGVEPGKHLLLAETDSEFAGAIVSALRDPGLRERLGAAARDLYCGEAMKEERARLLNDVLEKYVGSWR